MRIVIARMNHETNSFSPVPTPLSAFNPRWGDEALIAGIGSATAMGAFIAFAERVGASIRTPVFAHANPSGPVELAAWERMAAAIVDEVAKGCEVVLLDLHGAMVTTDGGDGEGALLARVRAAAPHAKIGVALDLHTNLSQLMVDNADVLVGFKTYPHIDMVETGEHVVRVIEGMLEDGCGTYKSKVHPPLLAHTLQMNTEVPGAMRDAIAAARAAEAQPGVLAVSVFGGFPLADIADAGMSVLVVAQEQRLADETARKIARQLWQTREAFVFHEDELSDSLAHAQQLADSSGNGPVLLLDHGDNCMSGGTCDTMDVLAAALDRGLTEIITGPICDPTAVAVMHDAGIGAQVELQLGNQMLRPNGTVSPIAVTGKVVAVSDGQYVVSGPTYTGMRCSMGRAAVIDLGTAQVLVSEEPHEPWDLGVFHSVELDPTRCRYLILKSRMYYRPVFQPISRATVHCASPGVTSSDYTLFPYRHVPRPVFPIEPGTRWDADA
ncbi:TPA: M81 family metallopeptidase [Pseudomonas aeruginosa]|uniref:M81 family metallopeptidase n=1 Tax=Pseudomonas TaxID=286 RepID=UPI000D2145E6|nr:MULTISPECIES: M81 family metallopeptidase [Pseudomonas]AVZ17534.1 M81 family peptidase [Pseudomonas aeruginosa]MCT5442803.1 M81 family metallopeptidase [Pseudomonas aeruginosa]HBO0069020.1 M81 family metallopeptidase [Pseudomonas aeruginosa]HCL3892795.1 M81 family metallopeptidase [Pseudomonas aeruginosa]